MPAEETGAERPILIVEDDRAAAELVRLHLAHEGYEVVMAADGAEGLRLARECRPRLIVLDLMLPRMDGLELCRALRADSDVPIIMVTARVEEEDRLKGLNLGADDYVTKPFSPLELVARVQAVLRRAGRQGDEDRPRTLVQGDIAADVAARRVTLEGRPVPLTATEFRVLVLFLEAPGRVLTRAQIIQGALGDDFEGFDRTVDAHISNLRRKLGEASGGHRYIHTVHSMGYRFDAA